MTRTATISPCNLYRYMLRRIWDDTLPPCYWIMLNPSTADDKQDDPTIRRVVGFSRGWGFGSANVLNLFALRSPNPQDLIDSEEAGIDIVGPDNDRHIDSISDTATVIAAWGAHPMAAWRAFDVRKRFGNRLLCLGTTQGGHPRHPLYVKSDTQRRPYPWSNA